jgi:nucleotide-binding universal stress UspA family protein
MLQRILVPLDGSQLAETALPHALASAQATAAQLILIHVLPNHGNEGGGAHAVDPLDWRLRTLERSRYLQDKARQLAEAGADVQTELLLGEAAERIVEFADERAVDLIVMSSHGQSGLSPWNVSSVVQKVILTTNRSVMIIPAYHAQNASLDQLRYRRIVAPLDGSRRAECVLPVVQALAGAHEARVDVVTMVARPEMLRRTPLSAEDAALADRLVALNRTEAEKYLEQMATRIEGDTRSHVLVSEDVIDDLYRFVEEQEADVLIFSAHGSSGNGNRRYGSLVTSFIAYGNKPLLIVQDLPPHKIGQSEAERAAQNELRVNTGARMVVNAPVAT